jgi:hypothetical protein
MVRAHRHPVSAHAMAYLTLFTIPRAFADPHVSLSQRNALASWRRLSPPVEIIVMGDDPGVAEAAAEYGAIHVPNIPTNEFGTPQLDWAFREAGRRGSGEVLCYVNTDIVLLDDLPAAIPRLPRDPYLAICRRWDCDIARELDLGGDGGDASLRSWVRENGVLDAGAGSDLFAFRTGTDFDLPAFVVGRPGWDNWLMGRALALGLPLIDMTPSVMAVHQNHDYTHVAGGAGSPGRGPEARHNREVAPGIDRYRHNPFNATHLLAATGLRRARSPRHLHAKLHAFITLRPAAWPLRRLLRLVRGSS